MLTLKGHVTGSGPMGNPKQPRQPIKSWTSKTVKTGERSRQNGIMNSPRGLYNRGKIPLAAKLSVGGEWALKECEVCTDDKKHKFAQLDFFRNSVIIICKCCCYFCFNYCLRSNLPNWNDAISQITLLALPPDDPNKIQVM